MSVVERAIKKIRGADPKQPLVEGQPIARSVSVSDSTSVTEDGSLAAGSFGDADSRHLLNFDFEALASGGLLAPGNERLADEYRAIKQPILRKAGDLDSGLAERNPLVLVASALPGEGKTFTSVNLSLSLANEKDWCVLLVDTDCRNPNLSRLLGVADRPGLLDFLGAQTEDIGSFIHASNIDRLSILPLGQAVTNAAELLASAKMQSLCAALSSGEFGRLLVVLDSSPLLLTPEPLIISRRVGQIIIVVRASQTPRHAVSEAIGKLEPTKAIGLVLNRASSEGPLTSYGYAYGAYGHDKTGD